MDAVRWGWEQSPHCRPRTSCASCARARVRLCACLLPAPCSCWPDGRTLHEEMSCSFFVSHMPWASTPQDTKSSLQRGMRCTGCTTTRMDCSTAPRRALHTPHVACRHICISRLVTDLTRGSVDGRRPTLSAAASATYL